MHDEESKETMVIDPAGEAEKIIEMLDILEAKLKYIYLTHCHGDHIGAVQELKEKYNCKVLIHRDDAEGLNDYKVNLTGYFMVDGCEPETLKANAIAILYPYVRAIISTYTANANITPLILPTINVNKLIKDQEEN